MEIAIRCITDKRKGYGNLSRCLVLADALREKQFNVFFIINNNSVSKELCRKGFQYILIPKYISHKHESTFINKIMNYRKCRDIIVDMREYGQMISKNFMNSGFNVILLDDAWVRKAYANLIFNGTIIKEYHNYTKINQNSKLFLGSKYLIINKEFKKHRKAISEINNKKKYHVIVSIGGSDYHDLVSCVVKSILNLTNIDLTIITGHFYRNIQKLYKLTRDKKNIKIIHSTEEIWKEFKRADVVISNAGNTLFELAVQGVPTICIAAVKHQIPYAEKLQSKGFAYYLGTWKNTNMKMIVKALTVVLKDKKRRKRMCLAGRQAIDGQGVSRVTNIITKSLKDRVQN